jgi:transposase
LETPELGSEYGVMDYQGNGTRRRYSSEFKARAVRMVYQFREETGQDFGAIKRVAGQLGCGVESLRMWVKRDEIDRGERPGVTSQEQAQLKELRQEVRELRRANEILQRASAFFAAELDRPHNR